MAQIENFTYFEPVEIELSASVNDYEVNSNNLIFISTSDINITGIDHKIADDAMASGAIALLFISNKGNSNITLKAKDTNSLYEHRFQMDADVVLKNGETAVFLVNQEGIFSYGILLSNNKYYYTVRDADAADVTAAEAVIYDSVPLVGGLGLNYKCLQFAAPYTFAGTETWVQEMTARDVILNIYNPVYFDLSSLDPYDIGREMKDAARNNVKYIQDSIIETFAGHLFKNGLVWTATQKTALTLYANKLRDYGNVGNIGLVRGIVIADKAIVDAALPLTVYDAYTATTYTVDVLTSGMLQHLIDLLNVYKKKYPDGTI